MKGLLDKLSTLRWPLAVALLLLGALFWAIPWTGNRAVGPLMAVEPPSYEPRYVHPALQIGAMDPSPFVWVSDFVDLGPGSLLPATAAPGSRVYVRSAARTRSFRIKSPPTVDEPFLLWMRMADVYRCRRYVQFAVVPGGSARKDERPGPLLRVEFRARRTGLATAFALAGVLLAVLPRMRPLGAVLGRRWGASLLCAILAVNVSLLWARHAINRDENRVIAPSKGLLLRGDFAVEKFEYPHILVYLQATGRIAYGLLRVLSGRVGYHDPYTNQVYFDGNPRGVTRALFEDFAELFYQEGNGAVRRLYPLFGAVGVLLVYTLALRVAGTERAGFVAGAALAVQPLYLEQSSYLLPNVPGTVLTLALALALLRPIEPGRRTFLLSVLCGFAMGFKYNVVLPIVFAGLLWIDLPQGARLRAWGVAGCGLVVGFLADYPSLPFRLQRFLADVTREGYHYGYGGHANYEADAALALLPRLISFIPPFWGNYLVAGLALVGAVGLLAGLRSSDGARRVWLLLGIPLMSLAFFTRQMVQFDRHHCTFLAFACLFAGLGASRVLDALDAAVASGRRSPATARLIASALALAILSTGLELWFGRGRRERQPTGREQAIAWIDAQAPLGSRVCVVEPASAEFQGLTVDRARYNVRRFGENGSGASEGCAYLLVSEPWTPPGPAFREVQTFRGPGFFGLPAEYVVYVSKLDSGGARPEPAGAHPETPEDTDGDAGS